MWPQIVLACWLIAAMCLNARDHGKPKEGNNNFFVWLTAMLLHNVLLYYGGFWTPFFK